MPLSPQILQRLLHARIALCRRIIRYALHFRLSLSSAIFTREADIKRNASVAEGLAEKQVDGSIEIQPQIPEELLALLFYGAVSAYGEFYGV